MKILISFLGWILVINTSFSQTTQNNSWPQYMGSNRNGKIEGKHLIKKEPKVVWRFIHNSDHASPIVVDENKTVYFGNSANEVYAIDSIGKLKWKTKLDTVIILSPAIHNGVLVVTPKGTNVYGLDAKSGKKIWKRNFSQKKYSGVQDIYYNNKNVNAPIIFDNKVYVNTTDKIITLDIKTGKTLSTTQEKGVFNLNLPPLITDSTIYSGSGYRYIHAFERLTGKLKWTAETLNSNEGKPFIYKDTLFITGKYTSALLSPETGKIYDSYKKEVALKNKYGITKNDSYFYTESYYDYGSPAIKVNINTDKEIWYYLSSGKTISEPVMIGDLLCFGDSKGYFYGLKSDDGKEVFKIMVNEYTYFSISNPIAYAHGRIYISTNDRKYNKSEIVVLE